MQRMILFLIMVCLLCPGHTPAQDTSSGSATCDSWISKLVSIQGSVKVKRNDGTHWQPTHLEDTFCPGDRIRVGANSRAAVVLANEAVMRLDQHTTIVFQGVETKKSFLLDLLEGAAHFFSRKMRSLKFSTPFVNGVVEGTEFLVRVNADKASIVLFEGQILAENARGRLVLAEGQSALVQANEAPRLETIVRPRDASHWTLYYPPILYMDATQFGEADSEQWKRIISRSIGYYHNNDLARAHQTIDQVDEAVDDIRFYLYRAGLRLGVGQSTAAQTDIEQALALDAENSTAWALRAVIAVVQNQKPFAYTAAQKAVAFDPDSVAARIALSYVLQARFDLEKAHEQVRLAVEKAPDNGIAWARLAELCLSLEMQDAALAAARKASELSPKLARPQTVFGYAYLAQLKTSEAQKAFKRAIELDSAAPLPRLGLGLATIQQGRLDEGRGHIEIAAGLDPGNALIRSYLAKAYFDEKRDAVAARQLDIAKKLDPSDPTPWFYDALRKQTLNRPVEALQDIQQSIRLNANRAAYRSKLALESDLAARSASVGRIYRNLGFEPLALAQGWKSIERDPGNYSAHRLLADSYSDQPRHEVARISELLQSQLLQPLNVTPVQPQLAEPGLSILDSEGPTDQAFNEFNPLFLRNRPVLQASAVAGNNETAGHDIVQSGLYNNLSYSLGHFHHKTDGFRENNDRETELMNVFTQSRLSHRSSLLAEYRYADNEKGDLPLRFDPDNFSSFFRQDVLRQSCRIGGRYTMTPQNDLIGTAIFGKLKAETSESYPAYGVDYEEKLDDEGNLVEAQHMYRSQRIGLISGFGHFRGKESTIQAVSPGPVDRFDNRVDHSTPYIYSRIQISESVTWTLGASADFYERLNDKRDQINPKFGITWRLTPATTIRTAVFRTFKRSLIADQTIEPTQIAGFNQLFDDMNGTAAWRYGAAADHTFAPRLFGGISFSYFDLDVAYEDLNANMERVDWEERIGRAYLLWTPYNWMSTGINYHYERFERDNEFVGNDLFAHLETHRIPVRLNFFCPEGVILKLQGTYIDQSGEFGDPRFGTTEELSDQFFVVDATVAYRLPRRYGIITLSVKNLMDERFHYQDTDSVNPLISPELSFVAKVTLNL